MKTTSSKPLHCALHLFVFLMTIPSIYSEPPVNVYILAGQSNMQGKGPIEGEAGNSLRHMVQNDKKKQFQMFVNKEGAWAEREDVWIHYDLYPFRELRYGPLKPGYGASSGQVGPEFGFGHAIGEASEGKVLLIKAAWGGKSIGHNFLPPSVGKYPTPSEPELDPGYFYHRTIQLVDEVAGNMEEFFPDYNGQGVKLAGICWHQGWNDQYGGLDEKYETNLAAFIKDIRSVEHGLGVPGLPFVIASSGMINPESAVVQGQIAIGDAKKYPEFADNVAVIDTHQPYGPDKMTFKFDNDGVTEKVGYHWNNNARSYINIGLAMAAEMKKLVKPKLPSRLRAYGTSAGVTLTWQLGTEAPKSTTLLRNGKEFGAKLSAAQTIFVDTTASPGTNEYELRIEMSKSPQQKLATTSSTYVYRVEAARSVGGVTLSWKDNGRFANYKVLRDDKVIEASLAGDITSYEDKNAPEQGVITYAVQPTGGNAKPVATTINLGPIDPGEALVYEPFHYYSPDFKSPASLIGMKGAVGTVGPYFSLVKNPKHPPTVIAGGSAFGDLPVMGNRAINNFGPGCAIKLNDSLKKAGLLKDGATMWMSYIYHMPRTENHHGTVTLQSDDHKHGIGFRHSSRQTENVVIVDGEMQRVRIGPVAKNADALMVAKFVWGKDGEDDRFFPMIPKKDLKEPLRNIGGKRPYLREPKPFNIDQAKLSILVLQDGRYCSTDEIRVGPTFESVVGGGSK